MYYRMMLYQSLVNADPERLGREIIEAQQKTGNYGWPRETEKMARRLGIDVETTRTGTKGKWNQTVKERIEEELVNKNKGEGNEKTETWRRIREERICEKNGVERSHKDNEKKARDDRHRKQYGQRQKMQVWREGRNTHLTSLGCACAVFKEQ